MVGIYRGLLAIAVGLSLWRPALAAEDPFAFSTGQKKSVLNEKKAAPLYEEIFTVTPNFVSKGKSLQQMLEEAGISFPEGASAKFLIRESKIVVVNTSDELDLVTAYMGCGLGPKNETNIHLFFEMIEVDSDRYHDWIFANRMTGDGTRLRKQVQNWVKSEEATIRETIAVICRSGQRCRVNSTKEILYSLNRDPWQVPNQVSLEGADTSLSPIPLSDFALKHRYAGLLLELDAVVGPDGETLDIHLIQAQSVVENGTTAWPPKESDVVSSSVLPMTRSMKFDTQCRLETGQYALVGTTRPKEATTDSRKRPIVLSFLRGDIATIQSEFPVGERRLVEP